MFFAAAVFATLFGAAHGLPNDKTNDQVGAVIDAGSFQKPSANVRPRFRYWIPDADVDVEVIKSDIAGAKAAGAGGVEVLGYFDYGGNPGSFEPTDWATYGWGTDAWKKVFDTTLEAHETNGLIMDMAMGPNQGQGVPAHGNEEGLMWDIVPYSTMVPPGKAFNGILPGWGSGKLQAIIIGEVISSVNTSAAGPGLPNGASGSRTQKTLRSRSLVDATSKASRDGHFIADFSSNSTASVIENLVMAVYLTPSNARNQQPPGVLRGPQTTPQDWRQNGSWTVDHFSSQGAKVVTDFWEKYMLAGNTKSLIRKVGNYFWEDSIEISPHIYWTPDLPKDFVKDHGYVLTKWFPILFHQNSLSQVFDTWFITDEPDYGNSHIADYRTTLTKKYGEYLQALNKWTNDYLGIQFSSQVGYNMAVDMQSVIPLDNAPETESLAFNNDIDGYRQYTGPANMAGKRVISSETGAEVGQTYQQTLPDLLWYFKRSLAGSVNQLVIHGYPYSGRYPNTTWPGWTTFTYAFSEMHGNRQPAWEYYSDALTFVARMQYIFQSGVPKMDVAFYQKITSYSTTPRSYGPPDLEEAGYTYQYLNPDNFDLPEAYVSHGVLAPKRQAYKALVLRGTDRLTVPGAMKISEYARAGLPVIIAGGMPSYLTPFDEKGARYVNQTLSKVSALQNVHKISGDEVGATLSSIGVQPLTKISSSGRWFTHWREDTSSSTEYVFLYSDSDDGHSKSPTQFTAGTVEFASTGRPYMLDAWSGVETPIMNYTQTHSSTTIYFTLAVNQALIIAFRASHKTVRHAVATSGNVLGLVPQGSGLGVKVGYPASGAAVTTSDGKRHTLKGTTAKLLTLQNWNLTVEHWEPPADLAIGGTIKHNTTHQLNELTSWQNINGLENASGLGFYETEISWPPSSDATGALISFGAVIQTLRVSINGHDIPALDVTDAKADITKYLVKGKNKIHATVSTTLANAMVSVWQDLRTAGSPPSGLGGSNTTPPGNAAYGLVEPVTITPYYLAQL